MQAKPTDAQFTLNDPSEVMTFLEQLVLWGSTAENAWHERQSCTGWALKAKSPFIVHNASATALSAATPDGAATASRQPSFSNAALADGGIAEDSATAGTSDSQDSTADAERDMQRAQAAFQTDQPSSAEPRKCASGLPTDSMHSAQGRPPTTAAAGTLDSADFRRPARNADMYDARRTSLDHYLSSSEASFTQAQQPKHDPVVTSSQPQHLPPNQGGVSDMTLDKNGERLTALLLDKLHGHASRSSDQEEMSSPPALTSNDSGSMAGYRSPFESLASYSYGIPEEADSLHAEYGSAASLLVMPSAELKD